MISYSTSLQVTLMQSGGHLYHGQQSLRCGGVEFFLAKMTIALTFLLTLTLTIFMTNKINVLCAVNTS